MLVCLLTMSKMALKMQESYHLSINLLLQNPSLRRTLSQRSLLLKNKITQRSMSGFLQLLCRWFLRHYLALTHRW